MFKIIVIALSIIAIITGANDLWKGAKVEGDFGRNLGENVNDPTLNFTLRFLGAIWMGFGALLLLFTSDIERYETALLLSFIIIIIGGIGRLYSVLKLGIEQGNNTTVYFILGTELLLVPALLCYLILNIN